MIVRGEPDQQPVVGAYEMNPCNGGRRAGKNRAEADHDRIPDGRVPEAGRGFDIVVDSVGIDHGELRVRVSLGNRPPTSLAVTQLDVQVALPTVERHTVFRRSNYQALRLQDYPGTAETVCCVTRTVAMTVTITRVDRKSACMTVSPLRSFSHLAHVGG